MTDQRIRLSGVDRKELAERIKSDIDTFCGFHYENKHREHLGASEIGEKCARKLWYIFRWMHREQFEGRMLRLFNRGHQTEDRFIIWLRGILAQVWSHSEDGEQFHISAAENHFGGSLDSILRLPERYGSLPDFLGEYKTHNDKNFKKLVKSGVMISHPKHYNQMCTYGAQPMYNFDYGVYFGINKNDDDIHVEVVALDHSVGNDNIKKAERIIYAVEAPNRIAASPAYAECSYCPMQGICHLGKPVDVNCRSCVNASPVANAEWFCKFHNAIIPKNVILTGCQEWKELPHR